MVSDQYNVATELFLKCRRAIRVLFVILNKKVE
jgi:hypothetical protein